MTEQEKQFDDTEERMSNVVKTLRSLGASEQFLRDYLEIIFAEFAQQ